MLNIDIQNIKQIREQNLKSKKELTNIYTEIENYFNNSDNFLEDTLQIKVLVSIDNLTIVEKTIKDSGLISERVEFTPYKTELIVSLPLDDIEDVVPTPEVVVEIKPIVREVLEEHVVIQDQQIKKVTPPLQAHSPFMMPDDALVFNGSPF